MIRQIQHLRSRHPLQYRSVIFMGEIGFTKYPLERRIQQLDVNGKQTMNNRLDDLIFHSVTSEDFTTNILPTETNDSHNVYFVHSEVDIQLWKGNIRIPLGGAGETWTVGVININSLSNPI